MVASNSPMEKAGLGYGNLRNTFKRITAACSDEKERQICHGTAGQTYCMDDV